MALGTEMLLFLEQELEATAKAVNERLEALAEVEAWQAERAHLGVPLSGYRL